MHTRGRPDFEHLAIAADGRIVSIHDIVRVIKGGKGVASRLRGIMIDITNRKQRART